MQFQCVCTFKGNEIRKAGIRVRSRKSGKSFERRPEKNKVGALENPEAFGWLVSGTGLIVYNGCHYSTSTSEDPHDAPKITSPLPNFVLSPQPMSTIMAGALRSDKVAEPILVLQQECRKRSVERNLRQVLVRVCGRNPTRRLSHHGCLRIRASLADHVGTGT